MFITVTHCSLQRVKRVRVEKYVQGHRRMEAWLEHCRLCPFKRGASGAEVPFHNSVIGNFMVYQDRLEINSLQLFGHPDRMIFYISISIFEVNIVIEQKQTWLVTIFLFFTSFHCPQHFYNYPCRYSGSGAWLCILCQQTSPKRWFANVNMSHIMTSQCIQ